MKYLLFGALACLVFAARPVAAQTPEPTPAAPTSAVTSDTEYMIGPGDTLDIFVWRNDELSKNVPVRPDGKISTPLVEDMVAVGKTPTQLARDMEKVLAQYIRSPKVNVIVSQAISANRQVRVVGQAVSPRALPFREGLTVLDVVIAVGGLSEYAAGNRAKVIRAVPNGKPKEIRVKLGDLLNKGDLRTNIVLQPGDVIVIPESRF